MLRLAAPATLVLAASASLAMASFTLLDPEQLRPYLGEDYDWALANVPFFASSDQELTAAYFFRWQVYRCLSFHALDDADARVPDLAARRAHITYHPEVGHIVTEFLPPVSWAGAYNTIAGTLGHHIMEGTHCDAALAGSLSSLHPAGAGCRALAARCGCAGRLLPLLGLPASLTAGLHLLAGHCSPCKASLILLALPRCRSAVLGGLSAEGCGRLQVTGDVGLALELLPGLAQNLQVMAPCGCTQAQLRSASAAEQHCACRAGSTATLTQSWAPSSRLTQRTAERTRSVGTAHASASTLPR